MNTRLYKYPRTYHLPFSPGVSSDDKILPDTECFKNKEIVITEKMDGENTTIYNDYYHARSIDSKHSLYHSFLLGNILPNIQYIIPAYYHICGEYLYAKHSIYYDNLDSYFLIFSIWNNNKCLSWDETIAFCKKYNLSIVPELWRGI